LVLEAPSEKLLEELSTITLAIFRTGSSVRLQIATEANMERALEFALRAKAKVISLNPVKMSLEDYFLAKVSPSSRVGAQAGPYDS
jgi:hypothetical protein